MVKDGQGNRWFCVQPSTFGSPEVNEDTQYAYFISFDQGAVGTNLENVPNNMDLTAQMLCNLSAFYHNWSIVANSPNSIIVFRANNIRDNADVVLSELLAQRDTLHQTVNDGMQHILCNFTSALFRNPLDNELIILRLIADHTKSQANGGRDFGYSFWYGYEDAPQTLMRLSDLADKSMISQHAASPWVTLPWRDPVANQTSTDNTGKRTTVEAVKPLSRFIYQAGRHVSKGNAPANMYREPLIAFAVKRVKDQGKVNYFFEDRTRLTHVSLMAPYSFELSEDAFNPVLNLAVNPYPIYLEGGMITVNGTKVYDFGFNNKP